jgi:hypothetical protein
VLCVGQMSGVDKTHAGHLGRQLAEELDDLLVVRQHTNRFAVLYHRHHAWQNATTTSNTGWIERNRNDIGINAC